MSAEQAVAAPRYHHQWMPNKVYVEPDVSELVVRGLEERSHEVEVGKRAWSSAQTIVVDPETGLHHGGSDPPWRRCRLRLQPAAGPRVVPLRPLASPCGFLQRQVAGCRYRGRSPAAALTPPVLV